MKRIAAACAIAAMAAGCLSNSHVIPRDELMRLSQTPPEERGRTVRVVQGFSSEDDPPEAPRTSSTTVVVVGTVDTGPRRHRHSSGGGGVSTGGGGGSKNSGSAAEKADNAWVWVILAVGVGIGLAATEGARYDGWVELHPMHPVHLRGPHGEYYWMPLAQVDPETAQWARKAIVRPGEGPWRELGRAPLDRRGFHYGVTLGAAQFPSIYGPEELGFMSHIQLGYFPDHMLGVLLDFGLGWGTNELDATVFESRNALELQFFPVDLGKIHAGGFGQFGLGARVEDGPKEEDRRGTLYGGGVLTQIELTTRLAITGRLGVTRSFGRTTTDIGVGLAIY